MKRYLVASLSLVAGFCLVFGGAMRAEAKKEAKAVPAGDLKWEDIPEVKGAQQAVLWGNPKKKAYGTITKIPGGSDFPLHWHSSSMKGIIISGTWLLGAEGKESKELGAGAYFEIPGGAKHSSGCKAGADC